MQLENRIVPVVGDFAGEKAIRAVGDYVRAAGDTINVFYVSNVEPYLFGSGEWEAFYDNVLTLPIDESSMFVRTFFGSTVRECRNVVVRTPLLGPIADFLQAYRNGEITNQCALVERSR